MPQTKDKNIELSPPMSLDRYKMPMDLDSGSG